MGHKPAILSLIFVVFVLSGFGCRLISNEVEQRMQPIRLEYWRVWDDRGSFGGIIKGYSTIHNNVGINYKKFRYQEYEQELIEAFAADRGPDIFSVHNTWLRKYQRMGLLAPMPAKITMAYPVVRGKIKKEVYPELRTTNSITLSELGRQYLDVVYKDVVISVVDKDSGTRRRYIYALPLSVDTLALFYNKDLFNNAGITTPPEYWNKEFQQDVKKLTKQNNKGQIIQAGVALGGGGNIERSSDILSALMIQNGTEMMTDRGSVTFHLSINSGPQQNYNPGMDALRFYTDFANPAKEVYSWNRDMDNSLELFMQNKLAMMFGYSYMLPEITAKAPKLNFATAKLPQIEGNNQKVNFANYWVEVVSKKSKYTAEAWDFIQFATRAENVKSYLDAANKPPAVRSLVDDMVDDEDIGIFSQQVLTADSWYRGHDALAVEEIFKNTVDQVISGQNTIKDAINNAAQKVQQTVERDD